MAYTMVSGHVFYQPSSLPSFPIVKSFAKRRGLAWNKAVAVRLGGAMPLRPVPGDFVWDEMPGVLRTFLQHRSG